MDIYREIDQLNPKQKEAVMYTDGPLLILAGAGSGKTRVITTRTAYLIHTGIRAESVLSVTFTNKAAREMKGRIIALLQTGKRNVPIISTFHSFCLRILRKEMKYLGLRKNFTIYDTSEQVSLLKNLLHDITVYRKQFKAEVILDRIGKLKNSSTSLQDLNTSKQDDLSIIVERVYPEYQKALRALNAVDFDDLLLLVIELFRKESHLLEAYQDRFRYIMVDEYQDTNRVQYTLLKLLAGKRKNLCVVGDDDQSVYAWRGANPGNILDFENDFPGTKVIRLEQNYRSMGNILEAANGVIRNNRKRMEKSLWTSEGMGPGVKIMRAPDGEEEAKLVAGKILHLITSKDLSYDDFAIIYRANIFSRPFEAALRKNRIPYSVVGGTSYFDRKEIKDLASYLKIILNRYDDISLLRIANLPRRGIGNTSLGRLQDYAEQEKLSLLETFGRADKVHGIPGQTAKKVSDLADMIDNYRAGFLKNKEMAKQLSKLIAEIDFTKHIRSFYKTDDVALKRIDYINAFVESLKYYEETEDSPSLQGFLETLALDNNPEKDEKKGGVTLVSLHSSKGLEFPVVFIVGVEDEIIPHRKSLLDKGGLEEERRLMYVGITRAMKELFLTYTKYRVRYGSKTPSTPSPFLEEIPAGVVEYIDTVNSVETDKTEEKIDIRADYAKVMKILDS